MKTILVVDDEPKIVGLARDYLEHAGFSVVSASDGPEALTRARADHPDLIVLDLGLPKLDGLDVARALRQTSSVPIVILSGRADESDKLVGLELGADDYVTKPFSPKELLARIHSVLRRAQTPEGRGQQYTFENVSVDFNKMELTQGGIQVSLTPHEFKLLRYFVRNPERVISRDELLNEVWGYNCYPSTRTVDNHLVNLRQKLEKDPLQPNHFKTVHGVGYKFVP